jgi:fused signal recognition particle receptor
VLDDVEGQLLSADVGLEATDQIIGNLREKLDRKQLSDGEAFMAGLKQELQAILKPSSEPLQIPESEIPFVLLVVGVNGVGKTTTIGKLAKKFQAEGRSVMLAAGDTFRAAAVEQLQVWGERNSVPVVAQATGADSASVIFDAAQSAKARNIDVLIADTAGRLHTKDNLMNELEKIVRVLKKQDERFPQEIMLVLDATTGQNALNQAESFNKATTLSGITLTKLDGTAKGGVVFALAKRLGLPIRFIGVGEQVDDLRPFDAEQFTDALFSD